MGKAKEESLEKTEIISEKEENNDDSKREKLKKQNKEAENFKEIKNAGGQNQMVNELENKTADEIKKNYDGLKSKFGL